MFVTPSRVRSDSFHAHQPQPFYSGPEYTPIANGAPVLSSNNQYPTNSHPYGVSSLSGDGPDLFSSHQLGAERNRADLSPSSSNLPRSHSHVLPRATHYTTYDDLAPAGNYPPRRDPSPVMIDTYNLGEDQTLERESTRNKPSSEKSGDSSTPPAPLPKRKARREKPRIELAPDQPPTTQGKPRARVYVACVQCRARKIRCDGAKPVCHNCSKRAAGNNECNYDPIPKRRGPDKTPGARQRPAKDSSENADGGPVRRRRRRDTTSRSTTTPEQQPESQARHRSRSDSRSIVAPSSISLPSPVQSDILASPVDFAPLPNVISTPETCYEERIHNPFHSRDITDGNLLDKAPLNVFDDAFDLSTVIPMVHFSQSRVTGRAYITQLDDSGNEDDELSDVSCEPSLNFSRKIWWDSLLSLYISPTSSRQHLTVAQRESAAQAITSDIRFLFNTSNYWFSFFHIPSFFGNYYDPRKRERIQPSLVLALLAMATFWQSSEVGFGRLGRERALRFRDEAQSALDASFNAGWIDETLAQAAWLLALFEVCSHPLHSSERSNSSMVMLDSIIRSLSLTFVDAGDPKASTFSPGTVPAVLQRPRDSDWFPDQELDFNPHRPSANGKSSLHNLSSVREGPGEVGCSCRSMTLSAHWPECNEHTPLWTSTPAWNSSWGEAEIRKESCRRLCWSSMILAAGHASYTTAHRSDALNLFISDPSNYAILFSGESIAYSPALSSHHSSKDTIWALYDRSFLLWHGCIRMRGDTRATDDSKAQFAVQTWLEADALEAALNKHTCRIERQFIFQAREYIFKCDHMFWPTMSEPEAVQTSTPLIDTSINAPASRDSFSGSSLKRRASSSFEGLEEDAGRKRMKEEKDSTEEDLGVTDVTPTVLNASLADDLAQDLQCGCCSELVYRPVIVNPCQHFFCGSCCVLWIRNGGTNCPACRGLSTIVTPFRALQSVIDTLLRAAPHKARTERERQQADEIYRLGHSMRIPPPREPSPEANVDPPSDFVRPCPHCVAGNPYGWRCPQPIPDPTTDLDRAWHLEDGIPPGHAHCGNCENLLATHAPTTTKCDLCQVFFCGIGVQGRCLAAPLLSQHPHALSDISDLIQSSDVYECFDSNNVEAEIMFDYLTTQRLTPRHIYREIVTHIQSQPRGFKPLMELELFSEIHGVTPGTDPDPEAPRSSICRQCAAEVFLWGLREWWIRERQKGFLEEHIMNKKNCPDGRACDLQLDLAHAREFNHIFAAPEPTAPAPVSGLTPIPAPEQSALQATTPVLEVQANPAEVREPLPVPDPQSPTPPALWTLFAREAANHSQSVTDLA
ncbi:hypothetical protein D9615_002795 [Tricholomella constricta]|uniref:Zn(2)-C6 fungal-type domain-containing protein n=1 Tax=Tricholomella constricta TaxID=117010 RepID=A0A8H5M6N1_9AGAR|nr:hypothetical protein D9615_002795 [Tricholomella constricta]